MCENQRATFAKVNIEDNGSIDKIGRASCRERVSDYV